MVERAGVQTGEVPISATGAGIESRALTLSLANRVVTVEGTAGVQRVLAGTARLRGRIVNTRGEPLEGARVAVVGTAAVAVTRANGEFSLDSLPAGSQLLNVRKINYTVTEHPVELSTIVMREVEVPMMDLAVVLPGTVTIARYERDLERVGYTARKKGWTSGYFYDGEQIKTAGASFTETMRDKPQLRVVPVDEWGQRFMITDARSITGGCVNYFVDGMRWYESEPGDIDTYVKPGDVTAIELYTGANVPPEFVNTTGDGKCMTLVIWTVFKVRK
jgi:TonB-dependent starch-binding outer membrane protein SusC